MIIGEYYKTEKQATKSANEKARLNKIKYTIIKFPKGYFVVAEGQLNL